MDNNTASADFDIVGFDEDYLYLRQIPASLRHFIIFEAVASISTKNLVDAYCMGYSWGEIERMVRKFCREDHRAAFGGVHPQLDPPRRVW